MKKLLIAGGSHGDIPLITTAQKMGYHVTTSGNRPDDLGHNYSDAYVPADYSDVNAICEIARRLNIDAICPSCNDFSMISSAYTAHALKLPGGYDDENAIHVIHDKDRFRQFALNNNIPSPKAKGFHSIHEALNAIKKWRFPLISKPIDLSGGKGITKIKRIEDAKSALQFAFSSTRANRIVVEEFIEGSRHGFSAIIRGKKVVFHFSDNEYYFKNQYLVSGASSPSTVADNVKLDLCRQSETIADILNLKDGIFHVQFIMRDDQPVIIEVTRRPPGDLYVTLVKHATGINYPAILVNAYTGEDISGLNHREPDNFCLRHCIMSKANGIIKDVVYDSRIEDKIFDRLIWGNIGDEIHDFMTYKYGIVFIKFNSMAEMLALSDNMQELIRLVVE